MLYQLTASAESAREVSRKGDRSERWPVLALFFAILPVCWMPLELRAEDPSTQDVTVRGKLYCIDESGQSIRATYDCSEHSQRFALKAEEGSIYLFRPDDVRAAIFKDPRVRPRDFRIVGRLTAANELEIIHLHSVRNGDLIRLYYRCEVCNITAYAPGPCWCCQQPFEFRESVEIEETVDPPVRPWQ